jgi:hypothetical protein
MEKSSSSTLSTLLGCSIMAAGLALCYANYKPNCTDQSVLKNVKDFPVDIQNELESRVKTFFGSDGIKKLKSSFVIVSCCFFYPCSFRLRIDDFIHTCLKLGCWIGRGWKSCREYARSIWYQEN